MLKYVPHPARILALSGWKSPFELEIGEEVLAYDPEQDLCVWTPLQDVRIWTQPRETVSLSSRSFKVLCSPYHPWAVHRSGRRLYTNPRVARRASEFRTSDSIIVSAPAEGGGSALTPREAALLGWLATDGTIRQQTVMYHGRPYGPYRRVSIVQSKLQYLNELRVLVGADGNEQVSRPRERDFGAYVSRCLPQHRFEFTTTFATKLLDKSGVRE